MSMNIFDSAALRFFLKIYLVILLLSLTLLLFIDKGDVVVYINTWHGEITDLFFKNVTHFGDGLFLIVALVFSLFVSKYHTILITVTSAFQGIITYVLKKIIFGQSPRPKGFFDVDFFNTLKVVEGVKIHAIHSFPSGHTLSAFSVAVFFTLLFPKKWVALVALCLAILAAISRMYLLQHFMEDVTYGSLAGVIIALGSHWLLTKWINPDYRAGVLSSPVIGWFKKSDTL